MGGRVPWRSRSPLAQIRRCGRITQRQLAAAMQKEGFPWHCATVCRVENGVQPLLLAEAAALAGLLGVPLEKLVTRGPGPPVVGPGIDGEPT
jgi:transcriptional regulator with XRE-family HTH domain